MNLEVKIDAEAVQAQVVNAIMQSSIGANIKAAIDEALTKQYGDWSNRSTLVQQAVERAVRDELQKLAAALVEERREFLREQLRDKLSDAVLAKMADAAWAIMEGKLKVEY